MQFILDGNPHGMRVLLLKADSRTLKAGMIDWSKQMPISPMVRRIFIDGLLWVVLVFCAWFMLTRHFVAFFAVSGRWQAPGLLSVNVGRVERDPNDSFTDTLIIVNKDGSQGVTRLLKEELADVEPGSRIWLLRTPYVTVTSPPYYRFSFSRLVTEIPEVFFLIAAIWLFMRFRSRLGRPFDAFEGTKKPTVTYKDPPPDSWGHSKLVMKNKDGGAEKSE
jgi:hypothetical protein